MVAATVAAIIDAELNPLPTGDPSGGGENEVVEGDNRASCPVVVSYMTEFEVSAIC